MEKAHWKNIFNEVKPQINLHYCRAITDKIDKLI